MSMSPERLTKPLIRRDDAPKAGDIDLRDVDPLTVFREASWEEAMERAAAGLKGILDSRGGSALAGFGSAKGSNEEAYLFQKLIRQGFGTNNVDHCTRLCHASSVAALMEGRRLGRGFGALQRCHEGRLHHRHRRPAGAEPPGRGDLFQAGRETGQDS